MFLGARLGELDETTSPHSLSRTGTASCTTGSTAGGPSRRAGEPSKASAFMNSNGYGPSFTNVEPVTVTFPTGRVEDHRRRGDERVHLVPVRALTTGTAASWASTRSSTSTSPA